LELAQWDLLIRQARYARLLGRLAVLLEERDLLECLPQKVRDHLTAARVVARKNETTMRWEVDRVGKMLAPTGVPVILLKGGAYVMAELPPARGRLYSDLDILVPKSQLSLVEQTLLEQGWEPQKLHPYDQRYYRQWMHELPPLIHRQRRTSLDVHHTILPETGRLHPDPEKLFQAARPLAGEWPKVLAPTDMILHSAAHLFQDGELAGGLRDLTDLDDLLRHFGPQEGFWDQLVPRARELDLARPLFYALRYSQRCLESPVPDSVVDALRPTRPSWPVRFLMDALVTRAMRPGHPDKTCWGSVLSTWLLYVRSHWLRMPPLLLASHLFRKALRHWYEEEDD